MFKLYRFDRLLFGFVLFFLGDLAGRLLESQIADAGIKVFGWYCLITGLNSVRRPFSYNPIPSGYITLVKFFILQSIVLIVRGYMIDYPYLWFTTEGMINYHFFANHYILPYLMPLVLFIPWHEIRFDKFVKYGMWVGLLAVVLLIFNYREIAASSIRASMGSEEDAFYGAGFAIYSSFAFACFLAKYIPTKVWRYNILGLVCSLLIMMMAARRGGSLTTALLLIFCAYYYYKNLQGSKRVLFGILVLIMMGFCAYYILRSDIFAFLLQRGLEDSRSNVDEALMSQMDNWQMIFGKGLNGRYYHPLLDDDYLNGWRYGSETGFYNLVLKGGFLYAFTYIFMLLIPAIKGLRHSNNMLCKVGGIYILMSLYELYPHGIMLFNVKFLMIWLMISLCMNPVVRKMSDLEIKQQFFPRI